MVLVGSFPGVARSSGDHRCLEILPLMEGIPYPSQIKVTTDDF